MEGQNVGVSGLINAYKIAADDALEKSEVIKVTINQPITLMFQYDQTNEVMKLVVDFNIKIEFQNFTENCSTNGPIQPSMTDTFEQRAKLTKELIYWF